MEINSPKQIIRRELENIIISLYSCGEFEKYNEFLIESYFYQNFDKTVNAMETKIHDKGYSSIEASIVFTNLVTNAAQYLGLTYDMAESFGSGYSWVRTGFFNFSFINLDPNYNYRSLSLQLMFFKLFFEGTPNYSWCFDSPFVVDKFKKIFEKFRKWNFDNNILARELINYKKELLPMQERLFLTFKDTA